MFSWSARYSGLPESHVPAEAPRRVVHSLHTMRSCLAMTCFHKTERAEESLPTSDNMGLPGSSY